MNTPVTCKNCGEPAMSSDATCWFCGRPLETQAAKNIGVVTTPDAWREESNSHNILPYLVITILVIVALFVVMWLMSSQPLLQTAIGTTVPDGWQSASPLDASFYVNLPAGWRSWDRSNGEQIEALEQRLSEDEYLSLGTFPLSAEVDDFEVGYLAQEENAPGGQIGLFMIVGTSRLLAKLSYNEALVFLNGSDGFVRGTRLIEDFDKSNLSISVETPLDDGLEDSLRCRQQFILTGEEALLVAVCATRARYPSYENQILNILESFQRLA